MILIALCMVAILGFCALAIDVGISMNEKSRLSNAVDAAALAGAQELIVNAGNAVEVVGQYLEKNGVDPQRADIVIFDSNTKISVTAKKEMNYLFARVLGFKKADVKCTGVAECAPISEVYSGIRPFAIEQQVLDFGVTYVLKEGGGSGTNGNYGALALGDNGGDNYQVNIVDGYNGHMKVGDLISTEPGNMSGPTMQGITALIDKCHHTPECTYDSFKPDCPKLITVIMVDSLSVSGRKQVTVIGFAKFFLEGVQGQGKDSIVTGRFVRMVDAGKVNETQADFGLKGVRLIQ